MLVQVAAVEWGPLGIRVNAIAPGVTRTPMLGRGPALTVEGSPWLAGVAERTALGRIGEPEDVAQSIIALHSMKWVTGQVLECDGGLSLQSPIIP
jgi:NAD(P)-dependent dehydrogenase (short-subunit alcohol dehydrogenase family)